MQNVMTPHKLEVETQRDSEQLLPHGNPSVTHYVGSPLMIYSNRRNQKVQLFSLESDNGLNTG